MAQDPRRNSQFNSTSKDEWAQIAADVQTAVANNDISVAQLAQIHYGRLSEFNSNSALRKQLKEEYPLALSAYQSKSGAVLRSFYSSVVWAWVLLSEGDGLKIGCRPKARDIIQFTNRSLEMASYASDYLLWSARDAQNILYAAVNQAFGNLEERQARDSLNASATDRKFMSTLDDEISRAESLVRRGARLMYMGGVLIGLALSIVAGLVMVFASSNTEFSEFSQPLAFSAILFGSLGGSMSVLQRFRAASLEVDISAGPWLLVLSGLFRPPVGAVAGLIAYMAHASGLLFSSLTIQNPSDAMLFYGVIAFFSGFSERIFQAQLGVSES